MALEKTLYVGAFIHCKTLAELDVCAHGTIGVGADGKIAFVLRDEKDALPEGWENAKQIKISDHGFFFPGFIGIDRISYN